MAKSEHHEGNGKLEPPAYGAPSRDAIKSVMDGLAGELGNRFGALRKRIDQLEHRMLSSAADAKIVLDGHVTICASIADEIGRIDAIVESMEQAHGRAQEIKLLNLTANS